MRIGDQYFKPGDKVMRVGFNPAGGQAAPPEVRGDRPIPEFGTVYCVADFFEGPSHNAVVFVGHGGWARILGNPYPIGWPASAFRKVEEIKLCISAVNRAKKPEQINA